MNKYIVITTINEPTEAILKFADMPDWSLIIVGDLKTPEKLYHQIDCFYMTPEYQDKHYKELSDLIGWNESARRNMGYIEAYKRGADVIASLDDDNIPYDNWGTNIMVGKEVTVKRVSVADIVADPLFVTNYPHLWHRGFPLELVNSREVTAVEFIKCVPQVQADLWDGDPDVDAIERLIYNPDVKFNVSGPFVFDKMSPFDSQNTFFTRDAMKYFCLLPGTQRVDDIWGSYLAQMEYGQMPMVVYGPTSVRQDRNVHSIMDDFKKEIYGTTNVMNLLNEGKPALLPNDLKIYESYRRYFDK
jgi:hypothetical protein